MGLVAGQVQAQERSQYSPYGACSGAGTVTARVTILPMGPVARQVQAEEGSEFFPWGL